MGWGGFKCLQKVWCDLFVLGWLSTCFDGWWDVVLVVLCECCMLDGLVLAYGGLLCLVVCLCFDD